MFEEFLSIFSLWEFVTHDRIATRRERELDLLDDGRELDLLESDDESVLLDWLSSYLLPLPLADSISGVIPPGPLSFTSLGW